MAYQALYRKWRPSDFEDVKGQDHIVETLKNQVRMNRVGHAYLFCGTRGTGKTSIAKIMAKAVNCEHPVDGNPCNTCAMCRAVNEQRSMNVIEIDAASNNGVDNIREIRDEVAYTPSEGRYKVYIIDEVHMLSIGAFNALLKTLEEPPSYVIFILATTESHKIPVTILSRCQRYDFRRITTDKITARLQELSEAEQIDAEDQALQYIARAADGSMRDALSLLDQCVAFYIGKKLRYENVLEVLGAVDQSVFGQLIQCITRQDMVGVIRLIDEIVMQGRELTQFVNDFTWYLRNLLIIRSHTNLHDLIEASDEQLQTMREESQSVDAEQLMRYIRIFSELSGQIRYATQKRVLVEVAVLKLCQPAMERNYDSIVERLVQLEQKIASGVVVASDTQISKSSDIVKTKEPAVRQQAVSEDIKRIISGWGQFLDALGGPYPSMLKNIYMAEGEQHQLVLRFVHDMQYQFLNKENQSRLHFLEQKIGEYFDKTIQISIVLVNGQMREDSPTISVESVIKNIEIIEED